MGRWAQARRRGRGGSPAQAFVLEPPASPDYWEVTPEDSDHWDVTSVESFPVPATMLRISYNIDLGPENSDTVIGSDTTVELSPGTPPATCYAKARWEDDEANALSDWSDTYPVVLPEV